MTPSPSGPVPIPYPNLANPASAPDVQKKVRTVAMFNHNMQTVVPSSKGDEAGTALNATSKIIMGAQRAKVGSSKVNIVGHGAIRLSDGSSQNMKGSLAGTMGTTVAPSQTKVSIKS